nr:histidine kinase [Litorivivens lipolytica]
MCNAQALLVLVILAELLALVITGLQRGLFPVDWQHFSLVSLFCLLVFLSSSVVLCALRHRLARLPLVWSASLSYGLVLTVLLLYALGAQWLLATTAFRSEGMPGESLWVTLFVGAVIAGIGLRYLFLSWQLRRREQSEMQARIQALQSRIQPHFLFNSLNTIASLIAENPDQAERAVEDLSALFRANLQDSRVMSTWGRERELCERYLRIESIRLGNRLRVDWQVDALDDSQEVLSLSLQPLLENAIVHGVQHLSDGGTIHIQAVRAGDDFTLSVENPLAYGRERPIGNHLACDNLHHRLQSVFGDRGSLTLEERDAKFRVEMRFPASVLPR